MEENKTVYGCLAMLYTKSPPLVGGHTISSGKCDQNSPLVYEIKCDFTIVQTTQTTKYPVFFFNYYYSLYHTVLLQHYAFKKHV